MNWGEGEVLQEPSTWLRQMGDLPPQLLRAKELHFWQMWV